MFADVDPVVSKTNGNEIAFGIEISSVNGTENEILNELECGTEN